MVERLCRACGKPFQVPYPSSKRKNCSYKCRGVKTKTRADKGIRKSNWIAVECATCEKSFERAPHVVRANRKKGWLHYCSPRCKDAGGQQPWRGRPRDTSKGRFIGWEGYVYIYVPPEERPPTKHKVAYFKEHRIVMGRALGRHLESHETVHHINGDKADNRPENLQLRNGRHGKGGVLRCRACGSQDIEHIDL